MKRKLLIGGAALALCSTFVLAQDGPQSLLPPGFDDPVPEASSRPAPRPSTQPSTPAPNASSPASPAPSAAAPSALPEGDVALPDAGGALKRLPSLAEIEKMTTDEVDELFGLKPKYDIPPGAQRALTRVGVLSLDEGGLPPVSLANQPAPLVRAALSGTQGALVSRWGHILLRRALVSRLVPPQGMEPAEFAALRAGLLNRMGESVAARALVQDVDTANYSPALVQAAFDAYIATGDLVGICPAAKLMGDVRKDPQWQMVRSICTAYSGEGDHAKRELDRALSRGTAPRIDVLLAKRFAGAAGDARQAVTIEWDGVANLNPWRFSLANALGIEIPAALTKDAGRYYQYAAATAPMLPLTKRAEAAEVAAGSGILSASAMVDLYAQIYADEEVTGEFATRASRLRDAYVARAAADRLVAIRDVWGGDAGQPSYSRQILTAFAAARLPVNEKFADSATPLIASMLSAGLDGNAVRWAPVVAEGSTAWGMLALAQAQPRERLSVGAVESFIGNDESPDQRKSRFLVAGLAGLGRLDRGAAADLAGQLDINLNSETRWTRLIKRAADVDNKALVVLLAGVGMQGDDWSKMTARHLYNIVSALDRVGLKAEARMIAAEAVARG